MVSPVGPFTIEAVKGFEYEVARQKVEVKAGATTTVTVTLKRMVRNSIDYAFADAPTKASLKQRLETAFHQFEQRESATAALLPGR